MPHPSEGVRLASLGLEGQAGLGILRPRRAGAPAFPTLSLFLVFPRFPMIPPRSIDRSQAAPTSPWTVCPRALRAGSDRIGRGSRVRPLLAMTLAAAVLAQGGGCGKSWVAAPLQPRWQVAAEPPAVAEEAVAAEPAPAEESDELSEDGAPRQANSEPGASAVPARLSLEEAVFLALQRNRSLRVQQFQPRIAGTFQALEQAAFDPVLYARYDTTRDYYRETIPRLEHQYRQLGEDVFEFGAWRQLPSGTRVDASAKAWREDDTPDVGQNVSRVGLSFTQALLRGRDTGANLARVDRARIDVLASEYELRGFAEFLVAEVESTYWDCRLAQSKVAILNESLELARRQLHETDQRIEAGVLPRTERFAAEAEVALREQALIDAESQRDVAQLKLGRLLDAMPGDGAPREVELLTPMGAALAPLDPPQEHADLAVALRPDVNEARARARQRSLDVVETRDGLLPQLDLFVRLGKTGYADSFGRSAGNLGRNGYDVFAGLHYEFPPANRAARAGYEAADLRHNQAHRAVQNLEQLVQLDVRTAYVEVRRAQRQIDAVATTVDLQRKTLEAEQAKFRAGESTSILVAQAQRDLLASELEQVEALVGLRKAMIDLYRLEGSLLIRRGIAAPGRVMRAEADG